ncbi:MAG: tetratricopeptide repeat protein [Acidobacteriia bacterium]|nr:tetratricopeptide repeat protein [Terriglobia bacterium]
MRARPCDRSRIIAWCLLLAPGLLAGCISSSRQLLDQAEASWRKGRYYEAIQADEDLYRLERRGRYAPRALLNIGNIYYLNLRKIPQAIEFYDRLTQEFPDRPEALRARRQLASIYANEFIDLDQAIAQYDKLLAAESLDDRPEILFQRANAYFKKGDYDRALRELHGLEESGIKDQLAAQVSLKIGNIYQVQKRFHDAIEPFRKVLSASCAECSESRRRAILNLAETYENLFDFDNAIETIRKLDETPENERYLRSEVERLSRKRKEVEKGRAADWDRPRVNPGATGTPRAPVRQPETPPNKKENFGL